MRSRCSFEISSFSLSPPASNLVSPRRSRATPAPDSCSRGCASPKCSRPPSSRALSGRTWWRTGAIAPCDSRGTGTPPRHVLVVSILVPVYRELDNGNLARLIAAVGRQHPVEAQIRFGAGGETTRPRSRPAPTIRFLLENQRTVRWLDKIKSTLPFELEVIDETRGFERNMGLLRKPRPRPRGGAGADRSVPTRAGQLRRRHRHARRLPGAPRGLLRSFRFGCGDRAAFAVDARRGLARAFSDAP